MKYSILIKKNIYIVIKNNQASIIYKNTENVFLYIFL